MAVSPREELRIVAITEFERTSDGRWTWHTESREPEFARNDCAKPVVGLQNALFEFFEAQGIEQGSDPRMPNLEHQHYSKLVQVGTEFHLRRYAYGAPDPFDPRNPNALAEVGYVPPGVGA
jgi:hypothetical protein